MTTETESARSRRQLDSFARTAKLLSMLPPTSADLKLDATRPYFLWWSEATVGDLRVHLASDDKAERAYWLGALLREANTRDVWLFVSPSEICDMWPEVWRHLGRSQGMWMHLLKLKDPTGSANAA